MQVWLSTLILGVLCFPFDLSSILALSMNISLDWACDNNSLYGLFLCITVSGDAIVKTDHVALIAFGWRWQGSNHDIVANSKLQPGVVWLVGLMMRSEMCHAVILSFAVDTSNAQVHIYIVLLVYRNNIYLTSTVRPTQIHRLHKQSNLLMSSSQFATWVEQQW